MSNWVLGGVYKLRAGEKRNWLNQSLSSNQKIFNKIGENLFVVSKLGSTGRVLEITDTLGIRINMSDFEHIFNPSEVNYFDYIGQNADMHMHQDYSDTAIATIKINGLDVLNIQTVNQLVVYSERMFETAIALERVMVPNKHVTISYDDKTWLLKTKTDVDNFIAMISAKEKYQRALDVLANTIVSEAE